MIASIFFVLLMKGLNQSPCTFCGDCVAIFSAGMHFSQENHHPFPKKKEHIETAVPYTIKVLVTTGIGDGGAPGRISRGARLNGRLRMASAAALRNSAICILL